MRCAECASLADPASIALALSAASVIILAIATLMTAGALMSPKNTTAALIDGGYVIAMGVIMIAAQGIL